MDINDGAGLPSYMERTKEYSGSKRMPIPDLCYCHNQYDNACILSAALCIVSGTTIVVPI